MTRATVNTDASWCPNTKAGGWAAWVAIDGGTRLKHAGQFHRRPKSSGEAEYWALLNGAWLAARHGATELLLQSDCTGALAKVVKRHEPEVAALHELCEGLSIRTKWVKAHTHKGTARHWVNDWCDRQAKKHMKRQRRATPRKGK